MKFTQFIDCSKQLCERIVCLRSKLFHLCSGIYEVRIFWGIIMLSLLTYCYRAKLIIKHVKQRFASTMLFFIVNMWVMISAMLHQPYNVILLPMQIVASLTFDSVLREHDLLDLGIHIHYLLGNVFYFYQVSGFEIFEFY